MTQKLGERLQARFDPQVNYRQIINRINQEEAMKQANNQVRSRAWLKWAMLPAGGLLAIGGVYLSLNLVQVPQDSQSQPPIIAANRDIQINHINGSGASAALDAQTRLDIKTDIDIRLEHGDQSAAADFRQFDFLPRLQLPTGLSEASRYVVYTRQSSESADYNILHDFKINYEQRADDGLIARQIILTWSRDFQPLRDYLIGLDAPLISTINGHELTISAYDNLHLATFRYDSLNFDVEAQGLSDAELIAFLESLLQS